MSRIRIRPLSLLICSALASSNGWSQSELAVKPSSETQLAPVVVTADLVDRGWSEQGQSVEIMDESALQTRPGLFNLPLASDRLALRLTADWQQKESAVQYQAFDRVLAALGQSGLAGYRSVAVSRFRH